MEIKLKVKGLLISILFIEALGAMAGGKLDCSSLLGEERPLIQHLEPYSDLTASEIKLAKKILKKPKKYSSEEFRQARLSLGLLYREEIESLEEMLGSDEVDPTLDDAFKAGEKGTLSSEWHDEVRSRERSEDIEKHKKSPLSSQNLIAMKDMPPYEVLFRNIIEQISGSKIFFGFDEPDVGLSIQYLKLKPLSEWPQRAIIAFDEIMYSSNSSKVASAVKESSRASGAWLSVYFSNNRDLTTFLTTAGDRVPVLEFGDSYSQYLTPYSSDSGAPPSISWIKDREKEKPSGEDYRSYMSKQFTHLGFRVYRPASSFRKGRGAGDHLNSGFYLPTEIIDWEHSFFEIFTTRVIPTESIVSKSHQITLMATALGKEMVVIYGSSGSLQVASQLSNIDRHLPRSWEQIPKQFRVIPKTVKEMKAYTDWLRAVQFVDNEINLTGSPMRKVLESR